jgi:hypothetical protein
VVGEECSDEAHLPLLDRLWRRLLLVLLLVVVVVSVVGRGSCRELVLVGGVLNRPGEEVGMRRGGGDRGGRTAMTESQKERRAGTLALTKSLKTAIQESSAKPVSLAMPCSSLVTNASPRRTSADNSAPAATSHHHHDDGEWEHWGGRGWW